MSLNVETTMKRLAKVFGDPLEQAVTLTVTLVEVDAIKWHAEVETVDGWREGSGDTLEKAVNDAIAAPMQVPRPKVGDLDYGTLNQEFDYGTHVAFIAQELDIGS
jgi:hypothetical protein